MVNQKSYCTDQNIVLLYLNEKINIFLSYCFTYLNYCSVQCEMLYGRSDYS